MARSRMTLFALLLLVVALAVSVPVFTGVAAKGGGRVRVTIGAPAISAPPATAEEARQLQAAQHARLVAQLKTQTTPEQEAAFVDDIVDQAEYEASANRTIQCLRDAGISVRGPVWDGWRISFTFGGQLSEEELFRQRSIYNDCYIKYQRDIDAAWAEQHRRVLTAAEVDAASAEMIQCLQREGSDIEAGAPKSVWWELRLTSPLAFGKCADKITEEYGALP